MATGRNAICTENHWLNIANGVSSTSYEGSHGKRYPIVVTSVLASPTELCYLARTAI